MWVKSLNIQAIICQKIYMCKVNIIKRADYIIQPFRKSKTPLHVPSHGCKEPCLSFMWQGFLPQRVSNKSPGPTCWLPSGVGQEEAGEQIEHSLCERRRGTSGRRHQK